MTATLRSSSSLMSPTLSQPRVHRLTLKSQYAEDALVDSTQWLFADEPFQGFDAKSELS